MKLASASILASVVALGVVASAHAAPVPVRATRAVEQQPAAGIAFFAWTQEPRPSSGRETVYATPAGQPRFRVSTLGARAFTASGAIDDVTGRTLVYGERPRSRPDGPGDLWFFDLATRVRSSPPAGVNTSRHEWGASLSGQWLLFARSTFSTSREEIMLWNVATGQAIRLDVTRGNKYAQPGSVRGNYATWIKCPTFAHCNAYVYDIARGTKHAVPNPLGRSQYAVSVTAAGAVYFTESRNINCGRGAALWRYQLGGARTRLLPFRRGRDVAVTSPVVNPDGSTSLFYDRFVCRTATSDIFRLDGV